MLVVLDASAAIAFLQGERGADKVQHFLNSGAVVISAANWSEILQKEIQTGSPPGLWGGVLLSYGVTIEPITRLDAEVAAALWQQGSGLSLADRICIALGRRLNAKIVTADVLWGEIFQEIEVIR